MYVPPKKCMRRWGSCGNPGTPLAKLYKHEKLSASIGFHRLLTDLLEYPTRAIPSFAVSCLRQVDKNGRMVLGVFVFLNILLTSELLRGWDVGTTVPPFTIKLVLFLLSLFLHFGGSTVSLFSFFFLFLSIHKHWHETNFPWRGYK